VLVLGTSLEDTSAYEVREVRRYLSELRVPLFVWWTGQPVTETVSENRRTLTVRTRWGNADDISTPTRMIQVTEKLRGELESQLTVWIEGSYLPHRIRLAKGVKGIRPAG
jgi:hypothetical protein